MSGGRQPPPGSLQPKLFTPSATIGPAKAQTMLAHLLAVDAEFPERQPYLYTSQFNIQGRLDPLTDNSHLSTASSLSPSREAVDETKIIKGVSR